MMMIIIILKEKGQMGSNVLSESMFSRDLEEKGKDPGPISGLWSLEGGHREVGDHDTEFLLNSYCSS